jgi:hypothetical protein
VQVMQRCRGAGLQACLWIAGHAAVLSLTLA